MLPDASHTTFWKAVADANNTSTRYVFEKMSKAAHHPLGVDLHSHRPSIGYLCQYLIGFFGGNKPDLWQKIGSAIFSAGGPEWSGLGKAFADDLTSTAWRLLVRYRVPGEGENIRSWTTAYHRS